MDAEKMERAAKQTKRQIKEFAAGLRAVMEEKKINQVQLAERTGLSVSFVSMLCRALREPTFTTVNLLANGLRVSRARLLGLEPDDVEITEAVAAGAAAALTAK